MVKTTYEAVAVAIPTKELAGAAKKFLLHSNANKDLIPVENIDSAKFGSSDLLFVNEEKTSVTIVRFNNYEQECERFIISSISYYLWLRESMRVNEILFNAKSRVEMYLFSRNFSEGICHMMDNLSTHIRAYLIRYNILMVEGLDEPAVYFERLTSKDPPQDELVKKERQEETPPLAEEKKRWASLRISDEELREFDRLKELYLT